MGGLLFKRSMFTSLRNSLDPRNEAYWFWGIALFALFVEMSFHALLPISISNDSYGYLDLSKHLFNANSAWERSVGYPLFLKLLGTNLFDTLIPVIVVQALMAVSVPLIVFKCLLRFGLGYAVLGALTSCLYFYDFVASLYILTEPAYVFSIAVYSFLLVRYFTNITVRNLLWVIAACWLIAMVRVSGSMHFLSLLAGIGLFVLVSLLRRQMESVKLGCKHIGIALAVFLAVSTVQHLVTNRVSSVIWPHFVFNWVYKDSAVSPIYCGIIKPENGPAAQKLFGEIERIITEYPTAFDTMKDSATKEVQALKPEKNGKYGPKAIKAMMNDIINNRIHSTRGWRVEGIVHGYNKSMVDASKLLGDAVKEAFMRHPEELVRRSVIVLQDRIWAYLTQGVEPNIVSFPTAYHHQIPRVMEQDPPVSLKPGMYKQWAYDLYQHTGNDPINRDVFAPSRYPVTLAAAKENIKADDLLGFGHYIAILGTQIIRVCWVFIGLGIAVLPFARNRPLLGSLICASIVPPFVSVFVSETDPRHLLMSSPVHVVTAVVALYSAIALYRDIRGEAHAK